MAYAAEVPLKDLASLQAPENHCVHYVHCMEGQAGVGDYV